MTRRSTLIPVAHHRLRLAALCLLLGQVEAALAAADEALALTDAEDLRELRAQGLWIREQALRQDVSQK